MDYGDIVKHDAKVDEFSGRGVKRYIAANRLSGFFNLSGLSETIDTACSSFFVGVQKAMEAIEKGDCEQAIIAGVQVNLLPFVFQEQLAQGILTTKSRTLPFDKNSEGYVRSEGVCSLILKRKSDAKKDKDHVYAWIKGGGIAHGGRTLNIIAPNVASHQQAFLNALENSGVDAQQIQSIEAHGTGMPLGDASELQAFQEVLVEKGNTKPLLIGAAKSLIGHLEAASGGLALLKGILSLQQKKIHGIRGLKQLKADYIRLPFLISAKDQPLKSDENNPAIIGLHAYGIGGVSAFLVLQETQKATHFEVEGNVKKIFVLSANSEYSLRLYVKKIKHFLVKDAAQTNFNFEHFWATFQLRREKLKVRLAFVVSDVNDLIQKLNAFEKAVKNIVGGFGSPALKLERNAKELTDLELIARDWVNGKTIDWQVSTLSRYPYPDYPMDNRKAFWIRQKPATIEKKTEIRNPNNGILMSKKSKYRMLDM